MSISNQSHLLGENQILTALSAAEYQRLVPHLEPVHLKVNQVLYKPGEPITHVYFLNQSIASLVCIQEDGSTDAGLSPYWCNGSCWHT
ncbi:Crp/Fnr family transcriptional regulator [Anabaenopsis circularis NIES-21]|uniref:Crp/Fnr family transcriptional regulator n=1 Tax=Anabaenopsis circularis NIES-21 TaxID=1085406 RepID=A0A1Z4GKP4_9CYAN|nr:Crp/Fnr family transcriptional regulator [Anabaenopsis circularis NIES-21]